MPTEGLGIRVRGQVQGVGFRPFVWRLATRMDLAGTVRNDSEGVWIEVWGESLDVFRSALVADAPPLARIDAVEVHALAGDALPGFSIVATDRALARTGVTPDAATCAECRVEIADPAARRHRYAFTNCTHCGPRFSIIEAIPYDRAATTMRTFVMCAACRAEYDDPADRRFHAQPIACPACGPRLWFEEGGAVRHGDALAEAVRLLKDGGIVALRAIGGFHLACDARDEAAVARLRARKRRPAKPFAVMAPDLATIRRFAEIDAEEERLLVSPVGPVVLLAAAGEGLAPSVAPGQWTLGFMLPSTPLHTLLLDAFGGPLVMTSGNLSGEPQVIGNDEAWEKLSAFADGFLLHDREIARRLDDSVMRVEAGKPAILRRARGLAPAMLPLPEGFGKAPPVAAYGAQLKAALCLTRDGMALPSHHLGDLDDALSASEFVKADHDYAGLLDHRPEIVACDLHPDYVSSRHAAARAGDLGVPLAQIQHHHAHIASVMADAGWARDRGPVLGLAFDGLGLGPDGTIWGGEFLLADYAGFERLAALKPVALPGGEAAQRDPWRNLLAQLDAAGEGAAADRLLAGKPLATLRAAMSKGINAPLSSSAGRLFDAVSAALRLTSDRQSYEGEAAMNLETAARRALVREEAYPFGRAGERLDPAPMWRALLADLDADVPAEIIAARFHRGFAEAASDLARDLARQSGAEAIALSGGCFQNATFTALCRERLGDVPVLVHRNVPANDGGLALGQAAIAAARALAG